MTRPPHHSRRSGLSDGAANTDLPSSSPAGTRHSSAKARPDASRFSSPAQNLTRALASVRIDAVAWTVGELDEAPDTWLLLAEALCGAAEHRGEPDRVGATRATIGPCDAWAMAEAGAS